MYTIRKTPTSPFKGPNCFPETIQECWEQHKDQIAIGMKPRLPATVEVVLNFRDQISRSPMTRRAASAIRAVSKGHVLKELDDTSVALVRSSTLAGYADDDLILYVCQSAFVDFSRAVGVAMCALTLTPGATFRDIAGLRRNVTEVLDTFYGHIGCATPYQSGHSNMYVTKYMISCARSVLGLYSHVPSVLSHFDEGGC
jgi:hypothetical protein